MPAFISPPQLIAALNWRYATKKFDAAKKIPEEGWHALEQSLVLSPSSIGLQPWKFFVVTDQAVKVRLMGASYRQAQAADCSHFVVFTVRRDIDAEHVERHIRRMTEVLGVTAESLEKFRAMTMGNLDRARDEGKLDHWQEHQIYIALGKFMACAAVLGIDTCPMEGIEPAKFDDILGLVGTDYATVVACAAGYRAADDKYATRKKVRFKTEEVVVRVDGK
jgi:nitroreductase